MVAHQGAVSVRIGFPAVTDKDERGRVSGTNEVGEHVAADGRAILISGVN